MAFLFDLDGTLIDSEEAHKSAEAETFKSLGYDFSPEDLYPFTGVPYKAMLSRIAPDLSLDTFFEAHRSRLLSMIGPIIKPFYDVDSCLLKIKEPALIVTSSPQWYVEAVLTTYPSLRSAFIGYVCADDITNGKPDPEPFLRGAEMLGMSPTTCTAIEDSPNGIASARAAGCYTIAVARDSRLDLFAADAIVLSLSELAEVA